ncbi:MAG: HK97 gp10 family phage protein [Flavobacterium sp.]
MANFDMNFSEDFLKDLLETEIDNICEEALNDAAPILVSSMKSAAKTAIIHDGESEMVDSIKQSKAKKAKTGAWIINVGPHGVSKKKVYKKGDAKEPVSNVLKAVWKEYGIPGKQAATPFLATATNNAIDKVMEKMQEVYSKKVGK